MTTLLFVAIGFILMATVVLLLRRKKVLVEPDYPRVFRQSSFRPLRFSEVKALRLPRWVPACQPTAPHLTSGTRAREPPTVS